MAVQEFDLLKKEAITQIAINLENVVAEDTAATLTYRNETEEFKNTALANNTLLGGIAYNASAPTPGKSGYYDFISAGIKPAWLTGSVVNVAIGDKVIVVYANSTYTYTYQANPASEIPDESISTKKTDFIVIGKNKYNKKDADIAIGKYLQSNGNLSVNAIYNTTGFIRVKPSTAYYLSLVTYAGVSILPRFINLYNRNKVVISQLQEVNAITTTSETYYIRITAEAALWANLQVEEGTSKTGLSPYFEFIKANQKGLFTGYKFIRAGSVNYRLSGQESYISKHNSITAIITGTIQSFLLGFGYNVYTGAWVEITQTHVIVHYYGQSDTILSNIAHGLTLTSNTTLSIYTGQGSTATVILTSGGYIYKASISFAGRGTPFFYTVGLNTLNVSANVFCLDYDKPVWLYGDSYLSFPDTERWLGVIKAWGFENFLVSNKSGGISSELYASFINDTSFGCPKYVVWCLGMNGGVDADNSTPNATWLSYVQKFIAVCEQRGYTPILATIPTVPERLHEGKNAWIRASGYRYIDIAASVGAQVDGTWYAGMLNTGDNVHPTASGAIAMAARVLFDFPEIMLSV